MVGTQLHTDGNNNSDSCSQRLTSNTNPDIRSVSSPKSAQSNKRFVDAQYNENYQTIIKAIREITDKTSFNVHNLAVIETIRVPAAETQEVIDFFLEKLNKRLKRQAHKAYQGPTNPTFQKYETGWEQYLDELGVPTKLYPEVPSPSEVMKLICTSVVNAYKLKTENQEKYTIVFTAQRPNCETEIVLKIVVVINIDNDSRAFFDDSDDLFLVTSYIDKALILGFMLPEPDLANDYALLTSKSYIPRLKQQRFPTPQEIIIATNERRRKLMEDPDIVMY